MTNREEHFTAIFKTGKTQYYRYDDTTVTGLESHDGNQLVDLAVYSLDI
jgi:hypothetical protein